MAKLSPVVLLLLGLVGHAEAQRRYHVDDDAAPGGNGLSWATAFQHPDDAFGLAVSKDVVWVAEGVYRPRTLREPSNPRSASLIVPQGVRVRGGFAGDEVSTLERRGRAERTIFSGELGDPASDLDDASTVVWVFHPDGVPPGATRISHLTIEGARSDPASQTPGGGIYSFNSGLVLEHITLRDNRSLRGGAIAAQPGLLVMKNCVLDHNEAEIHGGGVWLQSAAMRLTHCTLDSNRAGDAGGGVYINGTGDDAKNRVLTNSVIIDNVASRGGGLFFGGGAFSQGSAVLRNCTVAFNRALTRGGGIRANTSAQNPARVELLNSILWSNDSPVDPGLSGRALVLHSNVQDGTHLSGANLSVDPKFIDAPSRNLRLGAGSPCIDAGSSALLGGDVTDIDGDEDTGEAVPADRDGTRRTLDDPATPDTGIGAPPPDLGAYEY